MSQPRAVILRAPGTNCDEETADAWECAGAVVETWYISRALAEPESLDRFQVLTIPGGFSYGDDLGAGRIMATRLGALGDTLSRFRDRGGLILGICNGFQVLVRTGLLPGNGFGPATLTRNDSGQFEARLARLISNSNRCLFVKGTGPIELPVAHGEGKFLTGDASTLSTLLSNGQVVLQYADDQGAPTESYPENPNGSPGGVAGVCDSTGQIFGLMPHPERYIEGFQHPRWARRGARDEGDGLRIFRNAVRSFS